MIIYYLRDPAILFNFDQIYEFSDRPVEQPDHGELRDRAAHPATEEYRIDHPSWLVHPVSTFSVQCDFSGMFGPDFAGLQDREPSSVMLAEGSPIAVKWGRKPFFE